MTALSAPRRRPPWVSLPALLLLIVAACGDARDDGRLYDLLRAERGELARAEATCEGKWHRYHACTIRLESTTGIAATGRMLLPPGGGRVPAVVVNAGLWIGSGVVDALPAEFGDIAVLALDYPESIPRRLEPAGLLAKRGRVLRAGRETIIAFSLAGELLATHDRIDPERLAIIGGSFAVPFVGLAAALDDRFRNVALIYGAGEFPTVAAANFRVLPGPLNAVAGQLLAGPFRELEPDRHVHLIAPRPLLMINGRDDDRMPERAVRRLFEAAREPKELVWMSGGHLHSRDAALISALVDTAFARLPVLRGAFGADR